MTGVQTCALPICAIVVCEPRDDPGCTLPTNSSRFNFVITRLDPDLVHARLTFSHTYAHPGVYTAYFEGCCRSRRLHNNAGEAFHLRTSVSVLGSSTGISPRLALPALLHLKRADSYLIAAIGAPGSLQVAYRAGDLDEMGFGMDRALQLAWSDGNSHPFESPDGVTISSDGKLSLAAVGGEGRGARGRSASRAAWLLAAMLPKWRGSVCRRLPP